MNVNTLSYHAFLKELDWLYGVINDHVSTIGWLLSAHQLDLPRIPKRVGGEVVPFALGGDLKALFDFAQGRRVVNTEFVRDTEAAVMRLLFTQAADKERGLKPHVDWTFLKHRPLGVILLAASGRAAAAEGEWITVDELHALTGVSPQRAARLGVEKRKIDGRLCCDPAAVTTLLARLQADDEV